MALAKKELRLHLREHVVWERNTVWREMIGIERKAQAANLGIRRTLLGVDTDPAKARLQGDDDQPRQKFDKREDRRGNVQAPQRRLDPFDGDDDQDRDQPKDEYTPATAGPIGCGRCAKRQHAVQLNHNVIRGKDDEVKGLRTNTEDSGLRTED